jgi:hypothetical protein
MHLTIISLCFIAASDSGVRQTFFVLIDLKGEFNELQINPHSHSCLLGRSVYYSKC